MGIDLRNGNKGYELNLGWKAREYPADGWWDRRLTDAALPKPGQNQAS